MATRRKEAITVHYDMRIASMRANYVIGNSSLSPGEISEYARIELRGHMLAPPSLLNVMAVIEITFHDIKVDQFKQGATFGSIESTKEGLIGYVMVPRSNAAYIVSALAAKQMTQLQMSGARLHYRKARISYVELTSDGGPDDGSDIVL